MVLLSWAARTLSRSSGREESDGGDNNRVLRINVGADGFGGAWEKAEALSRVTKGGIVLQTETSSLVL